MRSAPSSSPAYSLQRRVPSSRPSRCGSSPLRPCPGATGAGAVEVSGTGGLGDDLPVGRGAGRVLFGHAQQGRTLGTGRQEGGIVGAFDQSEQAGLPFQQGRHMLAEAFCPRAGGAGTGGAQAGARPPEADRVRRGGTALDEVDKVGKLARGSVGRILRREGSFRGERWWGFRRRTGRGLSLRQPGQGLAHGVAQAAPLLLFMGAQPCCQRRRHGVLVRQGTQESGKQPLQPVPLGPELPLPSGSFLRRRRFEAFRIGKDIFFPEPFVRGAFQAAGAVVRADLGAPDLQPQPVQECQHVALGGEKTFAHASPRGVMSAPGSPLIR